MKPDTAAMFTVLRDIFGVIEGIREKRDRALEREKRKRGRGIKQSWKCVLISSPPLSSQGFILVNKMIPPG